MQAEIFQNNSVKNRIFLSTYFVIARFKIGLYFLGKDDDEY